VLYDTLTPQHWKLAFHVLNINIDKPDHNKPDHNKLDNTKSDNGTASVGRVVSSDSVTDVQKTQLAQLFAEVGLGKRPPLLVAQAIVKVMNAHDTAGNSSVKRLAIAGTQGVGVQYAPCCLPIPGDAVVGRLGSDGRLNVHTHDCKAISKSQAKDPDIWLDLSWGDTADETFYTRILVEVRNGKGVLAQVAAAITDAECHIGQVRTEDEPGNTAMMSFQIAVSDRVHLASVYRSIRRVPYTLRVRREGH
jgi:(p)ppGpp synthase/HD superfamily hydrolase